MCPMVVERNKLREELNMLGAEYISEIFKITNESSLSTKQILSEDQSRDGIRRIFYPEEVPVVEAWLEEQKLKEIRASHKEELSIAKEANEIAKKDNQISWLAVAISAISLIASAFALWWK